MNQYEVPAYLIDNMPEIDEELKQITPLFNIINSIQCLTNFTRKKIIQHNLKDVKKCFAVVENIYSNGNILVKDAIENIFIYSFTSLLNAGNKEEVIQIQAMMPLCLHSAYIRQIYKSGI